MANVSLRQIAEEANVSITTVSRVLRGRGEISLETRCKVQAIAEKLRYRPNLAAQSIHYGKSNTIGVIIPAAWNFDIRIAFGIHDKLAEHDVVPITLWTSQKWSRKPDKGIDYALRQVHHLIDRRVDGCILRPQMDFKDIYLREILERDLPIVTVDRDFLGSHADFVGTDDVYGARLAAQHLLELGHRFVVHLAGPGTVRTGKLRRQAFEDRISKEARCETIEDESFGLDPAAAEKVFECDPLPTGVFAANDLMAQHVYNAARRRGLRIPGDLSVVGFADLEFAEFLDPPLTTVRQQPYEMGTVAAQILLERINEEQDDQETRTLLLKPELVTRGSTARPAAQIKQRH